LVFGTSAFRHAHTHGRHDFFPRSYWKITEPLFSSSGIS
jgi:hypothetical protein